MTEEGSRRGVYPRTPPARPGFEFREAPSRRRERRERPTVVSAATALWLGAALLWLLATAVSVIQSDELRTALLVIVERDFPGETAETRDTVVTATIAVVVGGSALIALLQVWAALAMRRGRSAARVVLVLLAVLGALYTLLVRGVVPLLAEVGLVSGLILMVVAAVGMFHAGARPWFLGTRR